MNIRYQSCIFLSVHIHWHTVLTILLLRHKKNAFSQFSFLLTSIISKSLVICYYQVPSLHPIPFYSSSHIQHISNSFRLSECFNRKCTFALLFYCWYWPFACNLSIWPLFFIKHIFFIVSLFKLMIKLKCLAFYHCSSIITINHPFEIYYSTILCVLCRTFTIYWSVTDHHKYFSYILLNYFVLNNFFY